MRRVEVFVPNIQERNKMTFNNQYKEYFKIQMRHLSNILHNASQGDLISRDSILDSIKTILKDYEITTGENVDIVDFREPEIPDTKVQIMR